MLQFYQSTLSATQLWYLTRGRVKPESTRLSALTLWRGWRGTTPNLGAHPSDLETDGSDFASEAATVRHGKTPI